MIYLSDELLYHGDYQSSGLVYYLQVLNTGLFEVEFSFNMPLLKVLM